VEEREANVRLCAAGVLVSVALGGGVPVPTPDCSKLAIEARYVATPEPGILFHVRSDQSCTMYEADLPWGNFYSVRLAVRDASGKVCSRRTAPIDDPSDTVISLKPGEARSGSVPLTPHCPTLLALVSKGPVTVDWEYRAVIRRTDAERPKGRIVVSRRQ
jgi:hypothetical protein